MKPTLLMLQGLPASGKTTYAKLLEQDPNSLPRMLWKRVNKDDIRKELQQTEGWVWSHDAEADVIRIRDERISAFLKAGWNVVSDDTNFARKHKIRLEELARAYGARFEVKRFDTSAEECIRRDALRAEPVGEGVIRQMAGQYNLLPATADAAPVVPNGALWPAIICDLDGTLSMFKAKGHRGPYDPSRCDEDECNEVVRHIIALYCWDLGYEIIYLSGRWDSYRDKTLTFLKAHHCPTGQLYMRADGDHRNDAVVKLELFNQHIRDKHDVKFVLDDRDRVVKMWRSIGLTCLQVAEGDF